MDIKNHKPTLEQLQEFTDAELSEAVLIKLHPKNKNDIKPDVFGSGAKLSAGMCDRWVTFDINNWSDMGALANKYSICGMASVDGWDAFHRNENGDFCFHVWHQNELRAKATVFLMMDI
ncbi:MAG: hypothetical protein WBG43_13000 [Marinifilaceae bacterium]